MDENNYIEKRVDDQINWYDNKSQCNQKWFRRLKVAEIIAAAFIPFLVGYINNENSSLKIIVGLLGLTVVIISGILILYKFQENWIGYRTTAESLKHDKFLYLTKSPPYDVENPFPLFVERVETLISKENTNWMHYLKEQKGEKNG